MTQNLKDRIIAAARKYMDDNGMTQADLARFCGINESYLSNLINGKYTYNSGEKLVTIPEKYFVAIADAIGFQTQKSFWNIVPTEQFLIGLSHLQAAHQNSTSEEGRWFFKMIIGETGCGKTTLVNQYCKKNPTNTFRVTINDYDTVHDIIGEIAKQLGIELPKTRGARLRAVGAELKKRALRGEKNILIIDEGENTKTPGLRAYKAIYDMLKGYCAFVIFGTRDLPNMIEELLKKGAPGIQQFARRCKACMVYLPPIKKDFNEFLEQVQDSNLKDLLCKLCDNYGELHDFLEPALFSAHRDGVPLTEAYFRTVHNMTKKA